MNQSLDLDKNVRLLIVVPHPDDETLATGGLIQVALATGALLRVVIVTDGDNNPWPQRWIEKRWQIDADARRRWGKRRREEATAALARLGVAVEHIRHYGWPDQGLTGLLMCDSQCEDRLAAEIRDFAPTLIAAPSLTDRHPDHNALRVMLELAIARTAFVDCPRLGFVVHGPLAKDDGMIVSASDDQARNKQFALQAHVSQLVLSGKRMARIGSRIERFQPCKERVVGAAHSRCREWQTTYSRSAMHLHGRALYLIVKAGERLIRSRLPLPESISDSVMEIAPDQRNSPNVRLQLSAGQLKIRLSSEHPMELVFSKIERLGSRVFIYDAGGWQRVD